MTDNEKSLVVQEDGDQPEETLSSSLGGYQALILLVVVVIVMFLVFALPTPNNPSVPPPAVGTLAPVDVNIAFGNLADGDEVTSPFVVEMIAEGIEVVPAGEIIEDTGHFHIMVNVPFVEEGTVITADENHLHFGTGATEAELDLEPGEYTLRLQFADGIHAAYSPEYFGDEVTITVLEPTVTEEAVEEVVVTEEAVEEVVVTEEAVEEIAATEEMVEEVMVTEEAVATEEAVEEVVATEEVVEEVAVTEETAATEEASEETESTDAEADPIAEAIAAGDVELGQQIFNQQYDTAMGPWICASCHSVDESGVRLVGPGLYNLHERADDRAAEAGDTSGAEYVYNAIINPQAYIVPADEGGTYPENLMPPNYGEIFTEEELNAVTAYVLSLGYEE